MGRWSAARSSYWWRGGSRCTGPRGRRRWRGGGVVGEELGCGGSRSCQGGGVVGVAVHAVAMLLPESVQMVPDELRT